MEKVNEMPLHSQSYLIMPPYMSISLMGLIKRQKHFAHCLERNNKLGNPMKLSHYVLSSCFKLINKFYVRLVRIAVEKSFTSALINAPLDLRFPGTKLPEKNQCSFRTEIVSHSKAWKTKKNNFDYPEWTLDNKLDAYRFMSKIDVRTPSISFRGKSFENCSFEPATVVKPEAGYNSNGVFILNALGEAKEISTGRKYQSSDQLRDRMLELLVNGQVEQDLWYSEALILTNENRIAPDVKFYTFYGEVPLALKVDRNSTKTLYQTVDRNGLWTPGGKYREVLMTNVRVSDEMFEEAERISRKIPTPFLRLDFLLGEEMIFAEIGNMVGGYWEFSNEWDRQLGDAFARSRGRLYEDLRAGQHFPDYDQFVQNINTNYCV